MMMSAYGEGSKVSKNKARGQSWTWGTVSGLSSRDGAVGWGGKDGMGWGRMVGMRSDPVCEK